MSPKHINWEIYEGKTIFLSKKWNKNVDIIINAKIYVKTTWLKKDWWEIICWIPIVRNWLPVNETEN